MPTPSERVIAIDPGERAGWAEAQLAENLLIGIRHGVRLHKEMGRELAREHDDWASSSYMPAYDVIVHETWRPRPQNGSMNWIKGNELLSARLIGKIELIAELSGAKLVAYDPDRKTPALASMPAALRAIVDGCREQHDADALMHLWIYAFENWITDPANVVID